MKKLVLAVVMMMSVGAFSSSMMAQEVTDSAAPQKEAVKDEFTKIEPSTLPDAVQQSLGKSYAGATVKEAFLSEENGVKIFKLILDKEGAETTLFMDETGLALEPVAGPSAEPAVEQPATEPAAEQPAAEPATEKANENVSEPASEPVNEVQ